MSAEEKKRLNELGGKILREAGMVFEEWKDYDWIIETAKHVGYAHYYLVRRMKINEADATVYQRLVEIDTTLGTEISKQLLGCLGGTTRWDIIKVLKISSNERFKIF